MATHRMSTPIYEPNVWLLFSFVSPMLLIPIVHSSCSSFLGPNARPSRIKQLGKSLLALLLDCSQPSLSSTNVKVCVGFRKPIFTLNAIVKTKILVLNHPISKTLMRRSRVSEVSQPSGRRKAPGVTIARILYMSLVLDFPSSDTTTFSSIVLVNLLEVMVTDINQYIHL